MPLAIGITGGIGSGKTVVVEEFRKLGVVTFSADGIAKDLTRSDGVVRAEIVKAFGKKAYGSASGLLDREYLSGIVFSDRKKLALLNSIVHPHVLREIRRRIISLSSTSHYCLIEAALMFESGLNRQLDFVLAVAAREEVRIQRVMERDRVQENQVRARIASQLHSAEFVERSDFILYNDGSLEDLPGKVNFFHNIFLRLH